MSSESSSTGSSKKKVAATATAAALAAALLIGGTFSYLQSASGTVVNTFSTNDMSVSLYETDENGEQVTSNDDYNIIPGTSEDKDPTVSYSTSVEAYVFVEITDATYGLVDWTYASGWTLIENLTSTDDNGVTTYVIYQVVEATYDEDGNLTSNTLAVLKNNTVSYSADLSNEDMEAVSETISLTFKAYTIQTETLDDAAAAYAFATGGSTTSVSSDSDLSEALKEGTTYITLSSDVEVSEGVTVAEDAVVMIDLNGYTLSSDDATVLTVESGAYVVVTGGGTIESGATSGSSYAVDNEGGTVTLDGVTITNEYSYAIVNHGTMTLDNCTLTSTCTISSAIENGWYTPSQNTEGTNCVLVIDGGTYTSSYITVKNDDYGELTINGGTFTSTDACVLLNYNIATLNDGIFTTDASTSAIVSYADSSSGVAYETGPLVITGGTYYCDDDNYYTIANYGVTGDCLISGGTYLSRYFYYNCTIVDGYELSTNDDGTCTVVESSAVSTE